MKQFYKMGKKDKYRGRSPETERNSRKFSKKTHRRSSTRSDSSDDSDRDSVKRYSSSSSKKDKKHYKYRSHNRSRSRSPDRHRNKKNRVNSRSRSSSPISKSRKKSKKRSSSSDSQSENRSTGEGESFQQMSLEELKKLKVETQRQKDMQKAVETPEQKRLRRMAKKEMKERKRKANMGWDEEYMGYSNGDNPFGDEHLLDTFVWGKKLEKEGKKDFSKRELQTMQKAKLEENKRELEKVKKRRLEREREYADREKEREFLQRSKEVEYFKEWERQEDTFHLQQAKLRSQIRIEEGRAKPIDLLGKYISAEDDDFAVEMHEPYSYLNGLTIDDLEDLLEDIKVYIELEEGKNVDYWKDITIVAKDELGKLRKMDPAVRDMVANRREGINTSVIEDVASIFRGKSHNQLMALKKQMQDKLKGGEGIDVGYWESLLQQLKAHMARTRLRERHQENLQRKLYKLKMEQGIQSEPLFPIVKEENDDDEDDVNEETTVTETEEPQPGTSGEGNQTAASSDVDDDDDEEKDDDDDEDEVEEDPSESHYVDYELGKYSPQLLRPSSLEIDAVLYDPSDDMKKLEYMRQQVLATGAVNDDVESEFIKKAKEGMNDDEAQFSVETPLEAQTFLWSDKYRPRKPRFFNRVHTGFEWNKYNQTHYDIDNPPPKIVQGYKFNIFYPDLIEKTNTPEYTITPETDSADFAILRFRAGPPYEDIAFRIVNREWEYSYKRGFRCQFNNNIFQLWFHFKRYRYRR
ncbi:splicing factor Cactin-like [Tubulanus polymorphus]|uniref:splicing factor Cactin-like n=1 Tax=Tubulanus polymorphus TaxID=672921 RepID=UPI003DA3644B